MKFERGVFPGVDGPFWIKPTKHKDRRGSFMETWSFEDFMEFGLDNFSIACESFSYRNVIRGLHFQYEHWQGKLVRVSKGIIFDVAVDLRVGSPSFGHWVGSTLSDDQSSMLYIPPGFAHGFLAVEDSIVCYQCSDKHFPEYDTGIRWDDASIGINWPLDKNTVPVVSDRDRALPTLRETLCRNLSLF